MLRGVQSHLHKFVHILRQQVRMTSTGSPTTTAITSHFVEVNGAKLHYETCGSGSNVVLLLPGAAGSTRTDFNPQLTHMNREKFTLVAWDPKGYGKSYPPERDWPEHYFERDALDAAELMKKGGYKKYSMLGWSDGGITALILAARFPERIQKLVVWGANSYVTDEEIEMFEKIRNIDNWSEKMRMPFLQLYGEDYFRRLWSNWVDAFTVYHKKGGDICRNEVAAIESPTLIIHGSKDPMVPQFHAQYLHDHIQHSRLHFMPEAKHNPHLRYYEAFNSLVEAFILEK